MANPVVHFDIATNDKDFYSKLFAWKLEEIPFGHDEPYTMVWTKKDDVSYGINGGMMPIKPDTKGASPKPMVTIYVEVDDIEQTLDQAKEMGSTIIVPKTVLPQVTMAMFQAPDGNMIGITEKQ